MLKGKLGKRIVALASAAAMVVTASATGLTALTASAGVQTGEGTFEEGKGLPWHICESATASMAFDITDGIYAVRLNNVGGTGNGGEDRWDCQFRHRNLKITEGHTYRLTFDIASSNAGTFYTKIGDMNDDQYEIWHFNGTQLNMSTSRGMSATSLESALRSASANGTTIEYYEGWDYFKNNQLIPKANTWYTYAFEFSASQSNSDHISTETGEWTFHLGGTGNYTQSACFPNGTTVLFDNLMLIDLTSDVNDYVEEEEVEPMGIDVNQVGYYPNAIKQATLNLGDTEDTTQYAWSLKNASGSTVASGTTDGVCIFDPDSWTYNQIIDFTAYTTEGEQYYLECNGETSYHFAIGDIYAKYYSDDLLTYALNYFYQARSGIETLDTYIPASQTVEGSSKTLGREDCHYPDTAYIADEWVYIYTALPTYTQTLDCSYGWYDAGDYGKYVVNGGISLWTLMNMYERSLYFTDSTTASKWDDSDDLMPMPESENGIPNILDECKFELDFFLEMQRSDGMVYHKMHDYKWTGLAVAPYDQDDSNPLTSDGSKRPMRIVKPVTFAATLNFAAACAQASRLFEQYDASYAKTLIDAAEKAYAVAQEQYYPYESYMEDYAEIGPDGDALKYAPIKNADKGGGGYGDSEVSDEFYWAACELYITTGDSTYYNELKKYGTGAYGNDEASYFEISTSLYGGENEGTFTPFTWGTLNSVGTISLFTNGENLLAEGLLTESEYETICDNIIKAADIYYAEEFASDSAYGTPYHGYNYQVSVWSYDYGDGTTVSDGYTDTFYLADVVDGSSGGYEWGSNSMVINNAMMMAYAYDLTGENKYINGVTTAVDYLFGRNSISQSYITGYGENSTKYPHHRWWSGQLDDTDFPYAPYGVLSGGPNSNMNDPMVQGRGYKIGYLAPMACYLDNVEAWSVNECTVNWNSPLCWVISFLDDEGMNIDPSNVETAATLGEEVTTASSATETSETATEATTEETTEETTEATADSTMMTTTETEITNVTVDTVDESVSASLLGDVNLDGSISLADVVVLVQSTAGTVTLNAQQLANADCNQSSTSKGIVETPDILALIGFQVMIYTSLPVTV